MKGKRHFHKIISVWVLCLLLLLSIVPISVASAASEGPGASASGEAVNAEEMAVSADFGLSDAESQVAGAVLLSSQDTIFEDTVPADEEAGAKPAGVLLDEAAEAGEDAGADLAGASGQALSGNISSLSAGTYYLSGDATISSQIQLTSGTLDIDLGGHTLTMANNGSYFMISPNATLNIRDSAGGGTIYNSTYFVWLYNGGTFNLYSGTIDGSKMSGNGPQNGGAVYMYGPMNTDETFNMYGGTIRNCKSYGKGGAVYVGDASSGHRCIFNMYGGSLENNTSNEGGAIYIGTFQGSTCSVAHLEGKSKISIKNNSASSKGSAIYSNGDLELSGVLDIDDIVYLARNNFEGLESYPSYIKITGHLVVVGDGYIDLDTNYPERGTSNYEQGQALCGNTVVYNADQNEISHEEFYTYSSYFVNTTRNLSVSAGFDPQKNNCTEAAGPSSWNTSNTDDYYNQNYIDVMGQTMHVNALSRAGARESQDWNYLIYTERGDKSTPMREFYSIKIVKTDEEGNRLDGAVFSLTGTSDETNPSQNSTEVSGGSGTSGQDEGVSSGETYIYSTSANDEKLMIDDGTYTISEVTAPGDYAPRENIAKIKISHEMDGSVSISVVDADDVRLGEAETVINENYNDKGQLVNKEIVLTIVNQKEPSPTPTPTEAPAKWTLSGKKEGRFDGRTSPLGGAEFDLYQGEISEENKIGTAKSFDGYTRDGNETPAAGTIRFYLTDSTVGTNGAELGDGVYFLKETKAPQGYAAVGCIRITVNKDGAEVAQQGLEDKDGDGTADYAAADNLAEVNAESRTIALTITDEAIVALPATGGSGFLGAFLIAVWLMAGCGCGFYFLRRYRIRGKY